MAHFIQADGRSVLAVTFTKVAGAFGSISALAGLYLLVHGLCQDTFSFEIPLGKTRVLFRLSRSVRKKSDGIDIV